MVVVALFIAIAVACLAWTAACTAVAARLRNPWAVAPLIAGVGGPLVGAITILDRVVGMVWEERLAAAWIAPTLVLAAIASLGGVGVLALAGYGSTAVRMRGIRTARSSPPAEGPSADVSEGRRGMAATTPDLRRAAGWPVLHLAGIAAAAAVLAGGFLAVIARGIAAEGRALRLEVQRRMVELMPPLDPAVDNAAPLYTAFVAHVAADSRINPLASDRPPSAAEVPASVLASHAATLDLLRRAAAIPACRFDRDWARPSLEQLLPEPQALRLGAGLLARTAREAAAEGRLAAALADIAFASRVGRHLRGEPLLVIEKIATRIEQETLETLAAILPHFTPDQARSLDAPGIADLLAPPPRPVREFVADESTLLLFLAGTADGRAPWLAGGGSIPVVPLRPADLWVACNEFVYRTVFIQNEIAACRREFGRYRAIADAVGSHERDWPDAAAEIAMLEEGISERPRDGMMLPLLMPAIGIDIRERVELEARREAARVLLAATRHRLATGALPASIEDLVPDQLAAVPRDPFGSGQPLRMAAGPNEIVVWSIGPDGLDAGGPGDEAAAPASEATTEPAAEPPPIGAAAPAAVDDVGLRLAARAPETRTPAARRPGGAD